MVSKKKEKLDYMSVYSNHFVLNETTVTVVFHPRPADGPTYAQVLQYALRMYPAMLGINAVLPARLGSGGNPTTPAIAPTHVREGAHAPTDASPQEQSTAIARTAAGAQPSTSSSNRDAPNNPPPDQPTQASPTAANAQPSTSPINRDAPNNPPPSALENAGAINLGQFQAIAEAIAMFQAASSLHPPNQPTITLPIPSQHQQGDPGAMNTGQVQAITQAIESLQNTVEALGKSMSDQFQNLNKGVADQFQDVHQRLNELDTKVSQTAVSFFLLLLLYCIYILFAYPFIFSIG